MGGDTPLLLLNVKMYFHGEEEQMDNLGTEKPKTGIQIESVQLHHSINYIKSTNFHSACSFLD